MSGVDGALIAERFGVSRMYVYQLAKGEKRRLVSGVTAVAQPHKKLSTKDRERVLELHTEGLTNAAIARKYGVDRSTIWKFLHGMTYKSRFPA
jgi:DNA-binding NarL/FixJ family response regulator